MARRQQVEFDPQAPNLQPAAAPQSVPYGPRIPRPQLLPVEELAGLSETLNKISVQQQAKDNEAALEAGRKAGLDAGQDVLDELAAAHRTMDAAEFDKLANQKAFLAAEKSGDITQAQNPWRKVGFIESASRRVMMQYENDLTLAMNQATATVDQDGMPVLAKSPQQITAEVWAKYKDNPFLNDYYGSKVATTLKANADAKFSQQATNELAKNQGEATQVNAENSIFQWSLTHSLGKDPLTPEQVAGFDAVVNEWAAKGVDRRAATWNGVLAMARSIESADDAPEASQAAAQALRNMRALKVGTTTLGKDAEFSVKVDAEIARLENQAESRASKKSAGEEAELRNNTRDAQRQFLARVNDAKKAGGGSADVVAVAREMADDLMKANPYGKNRDLVIRNLKEYARTVLAEDSAALREEILSKATSTTGVADAQARLDVALHAGEISTGDFEATSAALAQRNSLAPVLEQSPVVQKAWRRLETAGSLAGLPETTAAGLAPQVEDIKSAFDSELTDFASHLDPNLPVAAKNEEIRQFLATRAPQVEQALRDVSNNVRVEREAMFKAAEEDIAHGTNPLTSGTLDRTRLTAAEFAHYQQRGSEAGDRTRFFRDGSYLRALDVLNSAVADKLKDVAPARTLEMQYALKNRFDTEYLANLDQILKSTEPAEVNAKILEWTKEAVPDFMQRTGNSYIDAYTEALAPQGKGAEAAGKRTEDVEANLEQARAMQTQDAAGQAKTLTQYRDPSVPVYVYDMLEKHLSGSGGFLGMGSPVTRPQMQDRLAYEGRRLLTDLSLTPEQKGAAAASMYAPYLIPAEDALADRIVPSASPEFEANLAREIEQVRMLDRMDPKYKERVPEFGARLRALEVSASKPAAISIKGVQLNPYTTRFYRTPAEMTDASLKALAKKYNVPEGQDALREFKARQIVLATRSTNAQ